MPSDLPTAAPVATIPHYRSIALVAGGLVTLVVLLLLKALVLQVIGR